MDDMRNIFDGIAEKAEQITAGKQEHLGADGLLHCDRCGEPTQCRVDIFGEERTVRCICRCDKEKQAAEKAQRERERKLERIQRLRVKGFERSEMQRWTFAADDQKQPKVRRAMQAYTAHFQEFKADGKGLLLFGDVGTGKTFAAACVANALIDHGVPVLMTNFTRIINRLQAGFEGRQEYLDSFNDFDLLVIDDLAAERQTDFVNEIVYSVIDSRYRAGLPMIITTNVSLAEMSNEKEQARRKIYSRVLERCHPLEVSGADRRKQKLQADFAEMQQLLGL